MKKRLLIFLLFVIICAGTQAEAQSEGADAFVVSLKGTAVVRDGKTGKPRRLRKGEGLFAGQQVSCVGGCKELKISYCNVPLSVTATRQWHPILSINCATLEGARGGAPKGEGVRILFPKESHSARPSGFAVRWEPFRPRKKIDLSIKVYLSEEIIWRARGVEGSRGSFASANLTAELTRMQRAGNVHLVLLLNDGMTPRQSVKFDLLSDADQRSLNEKLRAFNDYAHEVLGAVGRGAVFSEFGLYTDSAREFEHALAVAQKQSADASALNELQRLALMANYRDRNDARVRQLCKALKLSISSLPCACTESCQ